MASPYFEMGVAVRIKNHKFRWPYRIASTLSSDYTSGTSISFADSAGRLEKMIDRGDAVLVGESSNTTDSGKSEVAVVESSSNSGGVTTIVLKSALSYDYDSGDSIVVYGSKMPNNWSFTSSGTPEREPITIMPPGGGYKDRFAAVIKAPAGNTGYGSLGYSFSGNPFLESTCYRFGMKYKYDVFNASGSAKLKVEINDGNVTFFSVDPISSDQLTWTGWSKGGEGTVSSADLGSGNGSFSIYQYLSGVNDKSYLHIDDVYLEHAKDIFQKAMIVETVQDYPKIVLNSNSGFSADDWIIMYAYNNSFELFQRHIMQIFTVSTDRQTIYVKVPTTISTSSHTFRAFDGWVERIGDGGHYIFTEVPIRSSERYDRISDSNWQQNSANTLFQMNNAFKDRTARYFYSCRFWNVSNSFYNALMKFLWWQERGNLLNFHPMDNVDLPSVMTGRMAINPISKEHYSESYRSFDFYFEETVI